MGEDTEADAGVAATESPADKPHAPDDAAAVSDKEEAPQEEEEQEASNDVTSNDLVIRDGFPAFLKPGGTSGPSIDGDEPLPRHKFWAMDDAIRFHPDHLESLRRDCETVFTARDKLEGEAYSAGQTFFIPASMKPRCALEALALSIFEKHVAGIDKTTYDKNHSGANWWTLILDDDDDKTKDGAPPQTLAGDEAGSPENKEDDDDDEADDDEIALHFDADYELEDQQKDLLLHPRVATVTYLSDCGAPTLVLDKKSPSPSDTEKKSLEGAIDKAWLSHPRIGKHIAFDGRLLHGAPALFFPSQKRDEDGEPAAKRQKVSRKRVSLLVNIWLNHWVMDAGLLDDQVVAQLETPFDQDSGSETNKPFTWEEVDLALPPQTEKVSLKSSSEDPAGEDEITLCNRIVTVKYNPKMEDLHIASYTGATVEMNLEGDAVEISVGDPVPDEDCGEEDD